MIDKRDPRCGGGRGRNPQRQRYVLTLAQCQRGAYLQTSRMDALELFGLRAVVVLYSLTLHRNFGGGGG